MKIFFIKKMWKFSINIIKEIRQWKGKSEIKIEGNKERMEERGKKVLYVGHFKCRCNHYLKKRSGIIIWFLFLCFVHTFMNLIFLLIQKKYFFSFMQPTLSILSYFHSHFFLSSILKYRMFISFYKLMKGFSSLSL